MMEQPDNTTSPFGHTHLPASEKADRVQSVFTSVSEHYDTMNDWMSLGLHYSWKKQAISYSHLYPGDIALDLACGTCDITYYLKKRYPQQVSFYCADPNISMLERGKNLLLDHGEFENLTFFQHYAEEMPYISNSLALVICGFGFRNFTSKEKALSEIYRVLKPGGQFILLEFSKPQSHILNKIYQYHAQHIIPELGKLWSNNPDAYTYLVDSIETHPDQKEVKNQLKKAGFTKIRVTNILSGIVAIHRGIKC